MLITTSQKDTARCDVDYNITKWSSHMWYRLQHYKMIQTDVMSITTLQNDTDRCDVDYNITKWYSQMRCRLQHYKWYSHMWCRLQHYKMIQPDILLITTLQNDTARCVVDHNIPNDTARCVAHLAVSFCNVVIDITSDCIIL
jgi:hypothetical protein